MVALIKKLFRLSDEQAAALMPSGPDSPAHLVGGIIDFDAENEHPLEKQRRKDAAEGWRETR